MQKRSIVTKNIMLKDLIASLQFISIIPVGAKGGFDPKAITRGFPLAGLVLGLCVAVFDAAALLIWPKPLVAILDVVVLAILTGAFHIDGIADAADGLYGQFSKEKALSIMKDSRVGAMGLVAVVCVLAVKWAGISHTENSRFLWLVIIPAYARGGMIWGMKYLPYARDDKGTGKSFFEQPIVTSDFYAMAILIFLSLFLGFKAILLNMVFIALVFCILMFYKRKLGGITGDLLGAMTEITEAGLFLMASAGGVL